MRFQRRRFQRSLLATLRRCGAQAESRTPRKRELSWIGFAPRYNRLFSSARFRFQGDVLGCPSAGRADTRGNRPEPRLVYFIYSFLLAVAALALVPYWLVQGLRHGKYLSNLGQRLGLSYPGLQKFAASKEAILLHAVSVGEVLSGVTLARKLKDSLSRPAVDHLHHHHHRASPGARTHALCGLRHLFSAWTGLSR